MILQKLYQENAVDVVDDRIYYVVAKRLFYPSLSKAEGMSLHEMWSKNIVEEKDGLLYYVESKKICEFGGETARRCGLCVESPMANVDGNNIYICECDSDGECPEET